LPGLEAFSNHHNQGHVSDDKPVIWLVCQVGPIHGLWAPPMSDVGINTNSRSPHMEAPVKEPKPSPIETLPSPPLLMEILLPVMLPG